MAFDERARAERAMAISAAQTDGQPVEDEPEWPSAAARILHARLSAGLTHTEMARRLKVTVHSYDDLERYDDEAFTVLSLEQLLDLGKALNVDPVLSDPQALWTFNVEALHAMCSALDLDWVAALPAIS
jgi:transcriptional regulator with XRE-family HTH domain